jgi:DNA-binding NtrC family response regulator
VPSLRERAEDIPLLVEYFIDRYSKKAGKKFSDITKKTLEHGATIKLIGRIRADSLLELKAQIEASGSSIVLELGEITLVDVEAVRFLIECESNGLQLLHCSVYLREWIARERERDTKR